jgi:nicotinamide riboside kinase
MKIAFIGTHATGKTTLYHQLVGHLKEKGFNVGHVYEIVRDCPFPVNEATGLVAQRWVIFNQIINEDRIMLKHNSDLLVCDRSVLDDYAYLYNALKKDHQLLKALTFDHMATYNLLFLVPINNSYLKNDGFRSVNKELQLEIDRTIRILLEENSDFFMKNNIEICEVRSFEEVKKKVDEFLGKKSENLLK